MGLFSHSKNPSRQVPVHGPVSKVNLLPWRAARREHRRKEFMLHLVMAAILAVVVVIGWSGFVGVQVANQQDRNGYLTSQIKQEDSKIESVKKLQEVKAKLLARRKIIVKLQGERYDMVHLFDQLIRETPKGVRLISMSQKQGVMTLTGVAESNSVVADYMREVSASKWLGSVNLIDTKRVDDAGPAMSYGFTLTVSMYNQGDNQGKSKKDAKKIQPAPHHHFNPAVSSAS